jgi:hypothetical protein
VRGKIRGSKDKRITVSATAKSRTCDENSYESQLHSKQI